MLSDSQADGEETNNTSVEDPPKEGEEAENKEEAVEDRVSWNLGVEIYFKKLYVSFETHGINIYNSDIIGTQRG